MINDEFKYPSWLYDPQLVIPSTFEECLTYEMQVMWLYKKIEELSDGGDSEAVKKLQEEVAALAVKVDTNTQDISGLETEIGNLRTTVESYDERINTANTTAQNADRTATVATDTANTAKTAADEAKTAAASAEETANSALANISNLVLPAVNRAQKTADDAAASATALEASKQDKLTAGENIKIENNVISATGGGSGGTTEYYDLQNRPFLQEIDLSNATQDNPFDLTTLTAGAYMVKGEGCVRNSPSRGELMYVDSGPMFLYPHGDYVNAFDALFISKGSELSSSAQIGNLYDAGTLNVRLYPYNMSVNARPYGIQLLPDTCVTDTIYDSSSTNYVASTKAVIDYVSQQFAFARSNLITNIPIPIAGVVDEDSIKYNYQVNQQTGRFEITAEGVFSSTASMAPSITTIELGPLTKDEFLAFCSYRINPPDHLIVYSYGHDEIPYAMYWFDKVDPDTSSSGQWSWKYQFNESKSLYSGITGADALITMPETDMTVFSRVTI